MPLRLGADSVPEPDVAVVRGAIRDFAKAHPRFAEVIVEVADSTLALDRGRKRSLYAANGIPEYWIVNLPGDCVEVHRRPKGSKYTEGAVWRRGEAFPAGPAAQSVDPAELLP
jgi:Uma2 family endonuclease